MAEGWLVLELTPKGEKEDPGAVSKDILKYLPGSEVYIPAIETQIGDDRVTHYLMRGYAFVRLTNPLKPLRQYRKLTNTRYVNSVLMQGGKLAPVDASYIDNMREQIKAEVNQGIGIGDTVEICSGPYKGIEASVIIELPETKEVQVFVQLRSKQALLTLPRSVLKVLDRAPLSHYFARIGYLRAWAGMAKVLLAYDVPYTRLQTLLAAYTKVTEWIQKGSRLYSLVNAEKGSLDKGFQQIQGQLTLLEKVSAWSKEGQQLAAFLFFGRESSDNLLSLTSKYLQLAWLDNIEERILGLSHAVEDLDRELVFVRKGADSMAIQNVIVDGHNLAHRCFHAPGMNALVSKSGRSTGVVVGFLKSLGALKKRFPEAKFWVVWDGSSERRRRLFHDYKANRKTAKFADQEEALRGILPLLGVTQAWNPEEEADDVIGTLVRKTLVDRPNLIFSMDRDFLQLVTEDTKVLTPAFGSRKEILWDPSKVLAAFEVPPSQVVQLRSFFGDKSDNLPGVPRVPKKVLKSLLVAHGSVQGVYSSGLAGLNKGQYERLRTSEAQVKLNLEAMSLVEVEITQVNPDVDPQKASLELSSLDIEVSSTLETFFGKSA